MNQDYEKKLADRVSSALKEIPDLEAPSTLIPRVLAILQQRIALPWYRQAWPAWPIHLRFATLSLLLIAFGGLCFGAWQITRIIGLAPQMDEVVGVFSGISATWNAMNVLVDSGGAVVKHFGTTFIAGICLTLAFSYAMCVGLGAACVRLAFARK